MRCKFVLFLLLLFIPQVFAVNLVMESSEILPVTAYTDDDLEGYCNASDSDGADIVYYYIWYKDGVEEFSGNTDAVPENIELNVDNISSTETSIGEEWFLECITDSGSGDSDAMNSSVVTIMENTVPQIVVRQPEVDTEVDKSYTVTWFASDTDGDTLTISCYGDLVVAGFDESHTCFTDVTNDGSH